MSIIDDDIQKAMDSSKELFGKRQKKEKKPGGPKKLITIICVVILAFIGLDIVFGSFYTIAEEEQAVVCTFGQAKAVTEPGLHFKIPFVQTVDKVNTTIQGFAIGYSTDTDANYNGTSGVEDGTMITSDYNFIQVDFYAEYRIIDPVKAIYASENPELILANVAQNCIRTTIGSYGVDAVLTTGKNEIQSNIKQMIMDKMSKLDIGVQLVNITIQDAEPPTDSVTAAFKSVETAKQGKETALNNANKYRNEQIPKAEAKVDQILQDAEATKASRINEAEGQVARFNSMYDEYVKYPTITKQRMFYETMEDVLPSLKVVIEGTDGNPIQKIMPIGSFSEEDGIAAAAVIDNQDTTNNTSTAVVEENTDVENEEEGE